MPLGMCKNTETLRFMTRSMIRGSCEGSLEQQEPGHKQTLRGGICSVPQKDDFYYYFSSCSLFLFFLKPSRKHQGLCIKTCRCQRMLSGAFNSSSIPSERTWGQQSRLDTFKWFFKSNISSLSLPNSV